MEPNYKLTRISIIQLGNRKITWCWEDPKKAWDALEPELQAVVSHHVGTGNHTQALC